jgi:hypothetical protein
VLTACVGGLALAQQNATFVLTNGQRISGALTYSGGNDFKLDGRAVPQSEIAVIAFDTADPSAAELGQLGPGRNASELERHTIVMRDGSVVHGKLYNISADGRTVTINTTPTDRRDISSDSIARIYMNSGAARRAYRNILGNAGQTAVATSGAAPAGAITVNANQPWTDTGINVKRGDRISFQTTGTIGLAQGNSGVGPDGTNQFAAASRSVYPVPPAPVGALIFKVGTSAPSPIGSNSQPILMPTSGRLYLGVNDDQFADNTGAFYVTIVR